VSSQVNLYSSVSFNFFWKKKNQLSRTLLLSSTDWGDDLSFKTMKADLLVKYGGVAPKVAEESHASAIDKVWLEL
jgi:hypothetical protein